MYTLIIVDDHPTIRLAVKAIFEQTGRYKIVGEASNGASGIELVRQHNPSLVIADLDLPNLNGLEVIIRVRAISPGTKILVLSAQDEEIFGLRTAKAGASGFVNKNQDLTSIVNAADSVLGGYAHFPASTLTALTASPLQTSENELEQLTDKELIVLQYLARGLSHMEIAELMLISNNTVSSHKIRIFEKLGISTVVELVDFARKNNVAF